MKLKGNIKNIISDIIKTILAISIATALGYLFRYFGFQETAIVVVYVLAVIMVACLTKGYICGLISSVASTLCYNFFFTIPIYTFNVSDLTYIITFLVMAVTSIITSSIMSKLKSNANYAKRKEKEAKTLYNLSSRLSDSKNKESVANTGLNVLSEVLGVECRIVCFDYFNLKQINNDVLNYEYEFDMEKLREKADNNDGDYFNYNKNMYLPIIGQNTVIGVFEIMGENTEESLKKQFDYIKIIIKNIALAFDRIITKEENEKAVQETEREKYKSTLLRAISHDIRTPLTGILGTAEILSDITAIESEEHRMACEIYSDANWLNSMVENILSLTRLKDGNVAIVKKSELLEEIIGSAVEKIKCLYPKCVINVKIPEEPTIVPVDSILIKQLLLNLMDNAVKHCGEEVNISISVEENEEIAIIKIGDNGKGISTENINEIFELFYSLNNEGKPKRGAGLGLTICKTIAEAHNGSISVKNRGEDGGTVFTVNLPKKA